MMLHYNEELKSLHQQVARKKYLEITLEDLYSQKQELTYKVFELQQIKLDEQEDVERLEGRSLAAFFYGVIGKMDEKMDKERQEAYAASVKYDAAATELEAVEYEIQKNENELSQLQECEETYKQLLKEKADAIKSSSNEKATEVLRFEEKILHIENQKKEIGEAITAGKIALDIAKDIQSSLNSADGWATWDMFGGGLIADIAKHNHLDKAQSMVELLQMRLRKFKTELADVTIHTNIQVNFDGLTKFADFFFDGLFVDWTIANKISQSRAQIGQTITQIEEMLERLDEMLERAEQDKYKTQEELKELVVLLE